MKKLLLIRHAQATHEGGYIDFERPLTQKGIREATTMAERVKAKGIIPELIISSTATRTLATADIFTQHLPVNKPLTNKNVYDASLKTLLEAISAFTDEANFIALVGHNPGISEILYYLTGSPQQMDTSGVALIELGIANWAEVSEDAGELLFYEAP
ncbi:histidine phosphatase family protein [Mucilaginibacter sp. UR6-1]|uniref:SixA phosphatase family protein n=1 Tax=Mucilaginibacter sp. UR6-1 TaxID=1435643 RepID=UPI001E2BC277|nr:histidine phosphatase family protein [Mucilaginibacter sp. UR6-1]MCC8410024.1 histidine phosphatase family protein [Mucilaginibacter sp. UR6-1]